VKHSVILALVFLGVTMGLRAADPALEAAPIVTQLAERHLATERRFQGIPGIACSPKGRLWATWYAGGTGEGPMNYVLVCTSGDDGKTWSEPLFAVDPPGNVRAFDPCLWVDPQGRLWLFYAQSVSWFDGRGGVWAMRCDDPDRADAPWTAPVRIADGVMMNKPIVLRDGTWALPVALWSKAAEKHPELNDHRATNMVVSTDGGASWSVRGGAKVGKGRGCDEHMFVERRDGSVRVLIRTGYGIGEAESRDGGRTWSQVAKSPIEHPTARFFVRRLRSGNLLLVKPGPLGKRTGRELLTAYVSKDDGETWEGGLLLDARRGVSYPDGDEAPDGTIRLIYDRNRTTDKEILLACFAEADALAGKDVSGKVRLRVLVNQATGGPDPETFVYRPHADGEALLSGEGAVLRLADGTKSVPLRKGERLFTNRNYKMWHVPQALAGRSFVRSGIDGTDVVCTKPGIVFVATPLKDRNRDSVVKELQGQGFAKAKLPEFLIMFLPNGEANIVTTYQKRVAAGEKVSFGKWGVLIH
jgi:predicted neuraminidase